MGPDVPGLRVGPLLRHVDATSATVWVETERPGTVRVTTPTASVAEATWSVHGHHFAVVVVEGLAPGSTTPYEVALDEERVWPPLGSAFGPSTIRTLRQDGTLRVAFGSCRRAEPDDALGTPAFGPDALAHLAVRLREDPGAPLPDLMLMVGDQVYADRPSAPVLADLNAQGDASTGPRVRREVRSFEEYSWLYAESWTPEPVRWLLSTVPTAMILDDHDLRDDWNSSAAWREEISRRPWWRDRVVGALGSYWVYQHLGNLSPADLSRSALLAALRAGDDEAATRALDEFAWAADARPESSRWSFSRDLGGPGHGVRLVAVDCRISRRLEPGNRAIMDDAEWAWLQRQLLPGAAPGPTSDDRVDHVLVASTLPLLMPHGFSDVESWNEAVADGRWGPRAAVWGERVRRTVDLEHWPAFRASFDAMLDLLDAVVRSPRAPASVLVLSGDVHCSYTARATVGRRPHPGTAVHQLVMSPFRNPLHPELRWANRAVRLLPVRAALRLLALTAGVRRPRATWRVDAGPWFDNGVMTVVLDGRRASVEVEHVRRRRSGALLRRRQRRALTP